MLFNSIAANLSGVLHAVDTEGALYRRFEDRWLPVPLDPDIGRAAQVIAEMGGRLVVLGEDGQVWQRVRAEGVGATPYRWAKLDPEP